MSTFEKGYDSQDLDSDDDTEYCDERSALDSRVGRMIDTSFFAVEENGKKSSSDGK